MRNNSLVNLNGLREGISQRKLGAAGWKQFLGSGMEDATMPRVKHTSKRKRVTRAAVPALGAAGLTFGLAGSASASTPPAVDVPLKLNLTPPQTLTLSEEEIADVSLATFHLFDKENTQGGFLQEARGCGCGHGCGGRGCGCGRGCGGRGCGGRGCGCGGCGWGWGGGCCYSWGYCRLC
jgi:hypothetical protein